MAEVAWGSALALPFLLGTAAQTSGPGAAPRQCVTALVVTCCDKLGITSHHIPSVDTSRNKTSSKICGSLLRGRSPRIKKGKKTIRRNHLRRNFDGSAGLLWICFRRGSALSSTNFSPTFASLVSRREVIQGRYGLQYQASYLLVTWWLLEIGWCLHHALGMDSSSKCWSVRVIRWYWWYHQAELRYSRNGRSIQLDLRTPHDMVEPEPIIFMTIELVYASVTAIDAHHGSTRMPWEPWREWPLCCAPFSLKMWTLCGFLRGPSLCTGASLWKLLVPGSPIVSD